MYINFLTLCVPSSNSKLFIHFVILGKLSILLLLCRWWWQNYTDSPRQRRWDMNLGLQDCTFSLFLTTTEKLSFSVLKNSLIQSFYSPKIPDNWNNFGGVCWITSQWSNLARPKGGTSYTSDQSFLFFKSLLLMLFLS